MNFTQRSRWFALSAGIHFSIAGSIFAISIRFLPQADFLASGKTIQVEVLRNPAATVGNGQRGRISNVRSLNHASRYSEISEKGGKERSGNPEYSSLDSLSEGSKQLAYDPKLDRNYSKYMSLQSRIERYLTYPLWLQRRKESGEVNVAIRFHGKTEYSVNIRSEAPLLKVHVTKMFRSLIADGLSDSLIGLENDLIHLEFSFHHKKNAEVRFSKVHKNYLFFFRTVSESSAGIQLRESHLSEGAKYLELDLPGVFSSETRDDFLYEYQSDSAFGDPKPVLWGNSVG